jgi:DNA-binding beta-propeller fold protein YncE
MKRSSLALALTAALVATPALAAPAYRLVQATPLGAPDRWDYVVADSASGRVYLAHGDRLAVVDGATGQVLGEVSGIAGGTHGTGVSAATGQGFTDDGRNGLAIAFDLQSFKIIKQIKVDEDADGITMEPVTGEVVIIEGDSKKAVMIDPKTDAVVASIDVGEGLEYAAPDGRGAVFIAGNKNRDVVKIDVRAGKVVAQWPIADCASPHGLAVDAKNHRVFIGCTNAQMMVVNADTGAIVVKLPIGHGSDAVAFDPKRHRVFSSNGLDGTITIYQQTSPDAYQALEPIKTQVSGRTMDVDPATGRLYVAAAETLPPAAPGARPKAQPGTLKLMIFAPVP